MRTAVWHILYLLWLLTACASVSTPPSPQVTPPASMATITKTAVPPSPPSTATSTGTAVPLINLIPTLTPSPPPSPSPTLPAETLDNPLTIGYSQAGYPILAHLFGDGRLPVLLVGGIHGGYEWNTILLSYRAIDYFTEHPDALPPSITLIIIPNANPDGLFAVAHKTGRFQVEEVGAETFPGRFNGRGVDLNRNWDCQWVKTGRWRDQPVSAGDFPFSEPETQALRDFTLEQRPLLVLFWHSAANGVFAAGCPETFVPSLQLAQVYGSAAGYPVYERFAFYPVTGDAGDWLATQGIPSISVELVNHNDLQWTQNLSGIIGILDYLDEHFAQEECRAPDVNGEPGTVPDCQ